MSKIKPMLDKDYIYGVSGKKYYYKSGQCVYCGKKLNREEKREYRTICRDCVNEEDGNNTKSR